METGNLPDSSLSSSVSTRAQRRLMRRIKEVTRPEGYHEPGNWEEYSVHRYLRIQNALIHRCFRCGYCKFPTNWMDVNNCPPYARFRMEPYSCGGRLWLTRAWLNETLDWSEHLAEILYSCTTCRNCEVKCPLSFNVNIVNMVVAARGEMIERGKVPQSVRKFLENIDLHGNPYGNARSRRDSWMEGTDIDRYEGQEYLYYVGCTGSYDTRCAEGPPGRSGPCSAGPACPFGVLGSEENCDGNEVHKLGEAGLFEMLAENNVERFSSLGAKKIVTLSPHGYNAVKNLYPRYGGDFQVFHYTRLLLELIQEGRLPVSAGFDARVTYHDPCFLGRWNDEYETPRRLLAAVPSLRLVEMEKNRDAALCCGGGAGNFEIDLLGRQRCEPGETEGQTCRRNGCDRPRGGMPEMPRHAGRRRQGGGTRGDAGRKGHRGDTGGGRRRALTAPQTSRFVPTTASTKSDPYASLNNWIASIPVQWVGATLATSISRNLFIINLTTEGGRSRV